MTTTQNQNVTSVKETHRGLAGVGELRRVLNQVLTEVANGSRKLPITVYQGGEVTVYCIHHEGAHLTLHVCEKGGAI